VTCNGIKKIIFYNVQISYLVGSHYVFISPRLLRILFSLFFGKWVGLELLY